MDIIPSLELESWILTKLTKPSVPVNLVGPQVSLPLYWVPASRGSIHFFVRNKESLPCVRRYCWWVRADSGGNIFLKKYRGPSGGSQLSAGENIFFQLNKEELSLRGTMDLVSASSQALHI